MKLKTGDAVRKLAQMAPSQGPGEGRRRLYAEVDSARVEPGQLVEVREGEGVPVDGYVEEGLGYVDESAFTGEPMPAEKRARRLGAGGHSAVEGAAWW
jgi:Cu+-exporting ATPase